jgi:putative peptidoglycan lipid II flippase
MSNGNLIKFTSIVAVSTFLSRIMGFIRDMIIASYFGATGSLDGFFVAFRIPNLVRRLVAEGSLTISFIPVYTDYLVNSGEQEALKLAQKTLSILFLILLFIVFLGEVFSPQIVRLFAYGFTEPDKIELTVALNRVMFPYLFFVGLVAFSMGILNSHGYFFAPAFSPVLLNVGFIIGAIFFSKLLREPLYGLAIGVVLGGILQLILQIPYLVRSGFRLRVSVDLRHPGIRRIFRMIGPALFGIAVYQINILMSTILASMLPPGSISYLYYADRLTEIVLGIFIISIGNVILPEMSKMSAHDDMEQLKKLYISSIRAALFLAIPASIALMAVGFPIISVLFMRGEFSSFHADMTYRALFFASIGIASISVLRITTPTFYSLKDTKTPVKCAVLSFVVNIGSGFLLMQTWLKHAGLSLANSIAVTIQIIVLLIFLHERVGGLGLRKLIKPLIKFMLSGMLMAITIYCISGLVNWYSDTLYVRIAYLAIIVIAGGLIYIIAGLLLGVEEINYLKRRLLKAYSE